MKKDDKWLLYVQQIREKHEKELESLRDQLNQAEGRANVLEEWLTEYRDQLRQNAFPENKHSLINAINELLTGDESLML